MIFSIHFPKHSLISAIIAGFLFVIPVKSLTAQTNTLYSGKLEASFGYISPNKTPFWLRANQYGDVPLDNASMGYAGAFKKEYNSTDNPLLDWGVGFEGKLNVGNDPNVVLLEGYVKAKLWIIELKGGRSRDVTGLMDSTLSVGAFSISGNALGIPKIEIGIPEFWTIPILNNLFAIKGNYVHGWFGEIPMRLEGNIFDVNTYFHQKSFYGRLGNENWKLKLYGGFNHQVQWGNEADYYGEDIYGLDVSETYLYMVIGKAYGTSDIPRSKIGNHLGTIDMGLEYNFNSFRLFAYRQNFYEVGALYYLANIRDGLNGISFTNTTPDQGGFRFEKVLFELFYSKNQAGELWSPPTPSGDEDYYNNYQYVEGWSYNNLNLGNPLVGTRKYTREDLVDDPQDWFINNRIVAFHTGLQTSFDNWDMAMKLSYTLNYGTFGTSEPGHSTGTRRVPPRFGLFGEKKQFSGFLSLQYKFRNNFTLGIRSAFDNGELYYNSGGIMMLAGYTF